MKSTILLPLYIYPKKGAWDHLYAAISQNPDLKFLIIINPNSGPGAAPWWPNEDYVREIPRLNAYANVQVVGYVRATYCKRSIDEVCKDVQTYADRSSIGLEVQGIFVDETTNLYSSRAKRYLDQIDEIVKAIDGIGGERITIHNPGTAVNKELARPGPDLTVVVETSCAQFMTKEYQKWLATSPYERSRTCYMLHSVPEEKVEDLTKTLRDRAKYLFVTSATENIYGSFGSSWQMFLAAMTAE
ncbi:Spherulation-specific family 4 [Ampelomyces quisqualis]|uniref:Spherulation-specific family 4 n=1 Tax=Ampelomyces quisqualis TaxID=50730 RepID=A0A6A5QXD6_AMPQU|nr:Spherulation-specific family 4 [Ampelomyces quisqualis]